MTGEPIDLDAYRAKRQLRELWEQGGPFPEYYGDAGQWYRYNPRTGDYDKIPIEEVP